MRILGIGVFAALCVLLIAAQGPSQSEDKLWEYRNLGKAFYENPDTHVQAVEQLRKASELKPDSVGDRINLGLSQLHAGQIDLGVAELVKAQKQDPSIPHTWFNLGIAYKRAGDYDRAVEQFQGMLKLRPDEPISHYNLGAVLKAKGDMAGAKAEFLQAEKLNSNLAGPHFQLFTLEQRAGDREEAARERKLFEEVKKRNEGAAVPEDMEWSFYAELYDPPVERLSASEPAKYDDKLVSGNWDAASAGMLAIDSDGAGHADLLVWSKDRVVLYKHGTDEAKTSGLDGLHDVRSIAAGDFDNDGLADLCVLSAGGATLFHNDHGTFKRQLDLSGTAGATAALWLDYDHDYDLDLLLFGPASALLRNDGAGKFEDKTASFPFLKAAAASAVLFAVAGDTAARDVVVTYNDHAAVLYRDNLNEAFAASDIADLKLGAQFLDAQDFDRDGLVDLVSYKPTTISVKNDSGKFVAAPKAKVAPSATTADFNADNREDYARLLPDGTLHLYTNASPTQRWLTVQLRGVKNLKNAYGSIVEMKAGAYYAKKIYSGVPLAFATDGHMDADTIRITWPNGLIQNEAHQKSGQALKIEEAQRLSGSCPMIFTWNGREYQFITDVLGVAPLGASSGDGNYFPVDHDEYIQIPGSALKAEDGKYRIHITEELHEVSYLDKIELIAVDHPATIDVYTNDKFKSPPYPEFRLFGGREKIHPLKATEDGANDATRSLSRIDHAYSDTFPHDSAGVAQLHTLDLDFGQAAPGNKAALILNGWVDWADGSTFLGQSQQASGGLVFPYLQVKNAAGKWQTVVKDMGIPSGKPKTISVDLSGKFLSASRQVRIVTNLCVYWDEIFLLNDAQAPQTRLTSINADAGDLHFRGFSQLAVDSRRQQPEQFNYARVNLTSNWNPTAGFYTRYGDVRSLVTGVDDRLVVMGSGDELKLDYPAAALPALPQGWTRDFLLLVDGWAKDADANTAFSQSVGPLPFHAMSAYPYKTSERFPSDADHQKYLHDYLTRPALRLIRPLHSESGMN